MQQKMQVPVHASSVSNSSPASYILPPHSVGFTDPSIENLYFDIEITSPHEMATIIGCSPFHTTSP